MSVSCCLHSGANTFTADMTKTQVGGREKIPAQTTKVWERFLTDAENKRQGGGGALKTGAGVLGGKKLLKKCLKNLLEGILQWTLPFFEELIGKFFV